ncbi:hypothetical protein ACFL0L_04130 [Patescibacteria group bacterium]
MKKKSSMRNPKPVIETKTAVTTSQKVAGAIMVLAGIAATIGFAAGLLLTPITLQTEPTSITAAQEWSSFTDTYGSDWSALWTQEGTQVVRLSGDEIPVNTIQSGVANIDEQNADTVSKKFLNDNLEVFKIDTNELVVARVETDEAIDESSSTMTVISYDQAYQSLPVHRARVVMGYMNDSLTTINSTYAPIEDISIEPVVLQNAAEESALNLESSGEYAQLFPEQNYYSVDENGEIIMESGDHPILTTKENITIVETQRVIYPTLDASLLAWEISLERTDTPSLPVYYIDAVTGDPLARENLMIAGDISGTVTARIHSDTPGQYATVNVDDEYVTVGSNQVSTNASGAYSSPASGSVLVESELEGPYSIVHKYGESDLTHAATVANPANHSWNWQNFDSANNYERSNVFYHNNVAHDFYSKGDPFTYSYPLTATVDDPTCPPGIAAMAGYRQMLFCSGEAALHRGVVFHEYAHTVVAEIYTHHLSSDMNEALAFFWSATMRNNPVDSFNGRSVDNTRRYPIDVYGDMWNRGMSYAGAMWDLRQAVGQTVAEEILFRTLKLQSTSFQLFLEDLVTVDQNFYGGSHITDICDAFTTEHGIYTPTACQNHTTKPVADITEPFEIVVSSSDSIQVIGSAWPANGASFSNFTVEHGPGFLPGDTWSSSGVSLTGGGSSPIDENILATISGSSLTDGWNVFRVRVNDSSGTTTDYTRVFFGEDIHDGWPVYSGPNAYNDSSSVFADLNGDGMKEVIYHDGDNLHVRTHNGVLLWMKSVSHNGRVHPTVADLNLDGSYEILALSASRIYVWDANGNDVWGYPIDPISMTVPLVADVDPSSPGQEVIVAPAHRGGDYLTINNYILSASGSLLASRFIPKIDMNETWLVDFPSPAVGDIDGDPSNGLEIVVSLNMTEGITYTHVLDEDLNDVYPPKILNGVTGASPIVVDLDGDGVIDIIQPTKDHDLPDGTNDNAVYVWNRNTPDLPGWPIALPTEDIQPVHTPAVADLDPLANNGLEIVQTTLDGYIYAWRADGTQYFSPILLGTDITVSSPILVDMDGDFDLEIVVGDSDGNVRAWHHNKSTVSGFPKLTFDWVNNVSIADIDQDSMLELAAGSSDGNYYIWDLSTSFNADLQSWPIDHHDMSRSANINFGLCPDGAFVGTCSGNQPQYCGSLGSSNPGLQMPRMVCVLRTGHEGGENDACDLVAIVSDPKPAFYSLALDDWRRGRDPFIGTTAQNQFHSRYMCDPDGGSGDCARDCWNIIGEAGNPPSDDADKNDGLNNIFCAPGAGCSPVSYSGCPSDASCVNQTRTDLENVYHKVTYFAWTDDNNAHQECDDDNGDQYYKLTTETNNNYPHQQCAEERCETSVSGDLLDGFDRLTDSGGGLSLYASDFGSVPRTEDSTLVENCNLCGCPGVDVCSTSTGTCIPTCADGTVWGQCNWTTKQYCDGGTLVNDCTKCGYTCDAGLRCYNGNCVTCYQNYHCTDYDCMTQDICNNPGTVSSSCSHSSLSSDGCEGLICGYNPQGCYCGDCPTGYNCSGNISCEPIIYKCNPKNPFCIHNNEPALK